MMERNSAAARVRVAARRSDEAVSKGLFAGAALLSLAASVLLFFTGQREEGIFVGLWVPSILAGGALLTGGRHE
jgi:hypothetical protein